MIDQAEPVELASSEGFVAQTVIRLEEEGSITAIFGSPGTGKSVLCTRELLRLERSGKIDRIITNSPLVEGQWKTPIVFMSNKDIARISMDKLRPRDVVLVDECSIVWDAMEFKKIKEDSDLKDWVAQARKMGVHFIVVSQAWEEFVVFVRRKIQTAWMCRRLVVMLTARRFTCSPGRGLESPVGLPRVWFTFWPPSCVKYFNSRQMVGTGPGNPVLRQSRGWKWIAGFLFFVAGVLGFSFWKYGFLLRGFKPSASVSKVVASVAPAASPPVKAVLRGPTFGAAIEGFSRNALAFMDAAGVASDPHTGLRGGKQADWAGQWDVIQSQIDSEGRNNGSSPAGGPGGARGSVHGGM